MVASTMGTAPRSPATDRNPCSRHGTRNGGRAQRAPTSGRATSVSTRPATSAGRIAAGQPAGDGQQAEQHEQADLGEPGQPLGEARAPSRGAGAGTSRAAPRRRRPRGSRWRARARPRRSASDDQRQRRPAGRARPRAARRAAAASGRASPTSVADHGAGDELVDDEQPDLPRRVVRPTRRTRPATTTTTAGASLSPDSASRMPRPARRSRSRRSTENTAAASVEDTTRAEQHRRPPVHARAASAPATRHHRDADQRPHRARARPTGRAPGGRWTAGWSGRPRRGSRPARPARGRGSAPRRRSARRARPPRAPGRAPRKSSRPGTPSRSREPYGERPDQDHGGADQQREPGGRRPSVSPRGTGPRPASRRDDDDAPAGPVRPRRARPTPRRAVHRAHVARPGPQRTPWKAAAPSSTTAVTTTRVGRSQTVTTPISVIPAVPARARRYLISGRYRGAGV